MATTVVYSNNDGCIRSAGVDYAAALAGTGTLTLFPSGVVVGQEAGFVYVWQGFLQFDTSAIGDSDAVSAAVLSVWSTWDGGGTFSHLAKLRDYGATLETGDYVPGAGLAALTLLAHRAEPSTVGAYNDFIDDAMAANVNKAGATRMLIASSKSESGTAPAGGEYESHHSSVSAGGTTMDPKLTITHSAPSGNDPVGMLGFFGA